MKKHNNKFFIIIVPICIILILAMIFYDRYQTSQLAKKYNDTNNQTTQVSSNNDLATIYCVGDSLTLGTNDVTSYPDYLKESLKDYVPFEKVYPELNYIDRMISLAKDHQYQIKKASVFCTDSIVMEYSHLEEIYSFDTDLIEMETASFYEIAKLMEVPSIALLVVSDNLRLKIPLAGRS